MSRSSARIRSGGGSRLMSEAALSTAQQQTSVQLQYEAALLDLSRTVIAYHWDRIQNSRPGLSLAEVFEANGTSMARNSYNKSLPVARWVVARTAALLERRAARA